MSKSCTNCGMKFKNLSAHMRFSKRCASFVTETPSVVSSKLSYDEIVAYCNDQIKAYQEFLDTLTRIKEQKES